jgi:hypothetical protein
VSRNKKTEKLIKLIHKAENNAHSINRTISWNQHTNNNKDELNQENIEKNMKINNNKF